MSVAALVLILCGALIVVVLLLLRARHKQGGWWVDPGRAAGVLGATRGPFAVILAFVIFVAFQGYNAAGGGAQNEATATRELFKTGDVLNTEARVNLQANLICYARAVIHLDWPAMSDGNSSQQVDDLASSLDDDLRAIRVTDELQKGALGEIFTLSNEREKGRDERLTEAEEGVPTPVWVVLGAGALGMLTYVILFADPRERLFPQIVMVTSVTVIVVGGLLLVFFLSHPYSAGNAGIAPRDMERALREIQTDPTFAEGGLPPRCDLQGRPL
jgi:hypothetical protein